MDDDQAVRDALVVGLESEGLQSETFEDGESFLDAVARRLPLAVLLDVHMPGRSGLDVLRELKAEHFPAPVIIVTGQGDIPMAVEAIKHGAFDFIEKPFSLHALIAQLRAAIDAFDRKQEAGPLPVDMSSIGGDLLTNREREVLREIATGASSKEAGRVLGISPRTVEVHRARIMEKLGARNAADLIRIVFSAGA